MAREEASNEINERIIARRKRRESGRAHPQENEEEQDEGGSNSEVWSKHRRGGGDGKRRRRPAPKKKKKKTRKTKKKPKKLRRCMCTQDIDTFNSLTIEQWPRSVSLSPKGMRTMSEYCMTPVGVFVSTHFSLEQPLLVKVTTTTISLNWY